MMTRTTKISCPACANKSLDAAIAARGQATPRPGDLGVCAYCATALVFGADLRVRAMRRYEFAELKPQEARALADAQAAVRKFARGTKP